jgi:hypothetical protein
LTLPTWQIRYLNKAARLGRLGLGSGCANALVRTRQ